MQRTVVQQSPLLDPDPSLDTAVARAIALLRSHQTPDGYWWYTLEANESIDAESIFLMHVLGSTDDRRRTGLARRILSTQRPDGGWSLTYDGPGDLSTTIECYLACRMAGYSATHHPLIMARQFIAAHGGLSAARVFTKIHLALLGLADWNDTPAMPVELMLLPPQLPFSVYSFSSWARACIIPLLIIMEHRPVWPVNVAELSVGADFAPSQTHATGRDLFRTLFSVTDRVLKIAAPFFRWSPTKPWAIKRAEAWIREHIAQTEDIFPALSYGVLALRALGHDRTDPTIRKAIGALERFQHSHAGELPPLPYASCDLCTSYIATPEVHDARRTTYAGQQWHYESSRVVPTDPLLHQQCCISPVWDTPWAMVALQAAGVPANDPRLVAAGAWLLSHQIVQTYGDWRHHNPDGIPGGWAFEFENAFFPDVDDTIQVLLALRQTALPSVEKERATARGLQWCLSMQNDDGGWGAFDRNNTLALVNKIPFADHGACLDPASADITGRMLELLAAYGGTRESRVVERALTFLREQQEADGSWFGRWGVNFLYGTWAVLRGVRAIGVPTSDPMVVRGVRWLERVQHADGGFAESVEGYRVRQFVPAPVSVPSQTAWALMGLIAGGHGGSPAAERAMRFLVERQQPDGSWDERQHTGTGFPGHFYIRYHGYRHYFPLLALAEYRRIR